MQVSSRYDSSQAGCGCGKRDQKEFKQDDDGDDGHDIDALLAVRGPPDRRFWRVKWAGKNADGSEKWPDLGDGLGYKDDDSHWQDERNLGSETLGMRQRYFRFNRKPSQSSDSEVDGETDAAGAISSSKVRVH